MLLNAETPGGHRPKGDGPIVNQHSGLVKRNSAQSERAINLLAWYAMMLLWVEEVTPPGVKPYRRQESQAHPG